MLIGYDGRFITNQPTGNGVYATRLIETLSTLDNRNRYRLYLAGPDPAIPQFLKENVEVRIMPAIHSSAWVRVPILFPWELWRRPVDVFHAHYTIPPKIKAKVILTLHDFFWIVYPNHFVSIKRLPITFTIKKAIARADRILVGTSFIKHETMNYFNVPEECLEVIPYGVDSRFFVKASKDQLKKVRQKYGIDEPYILAVGELHPRKNLQRLLKAFVALDENDQVKLVLVGKPLWKTRELFEIVKKAGLENRVIATGYIPEEDLPILYQSAEVFCYPSLYEGFGFPIIEAMASGVPVATSEVSSCPDVGGHAAIYFNPLHEESIADTLHRILTDTELRKKHKLAGIEHSRSFTWEKTACRTIEVYRSLE
jgi:glycosyltransferase involved in cell wall biosynthesis